jgi:hypothetical protein
MDVADAIVLRRDEADRIVARSRGNLMSRQMRNFD